MAKITITVGLLLILLGLGFYFASESRSITAMIPAFFGLPVAALGAIGATGGEAARKHTAHIAVMITLLGALAGLGMGVRGAIANGLTSPVVAQLLLGAICAVHVVLSVQSFIAARKAREAV